MLECLHHLSAAGGCSCFKEAEFLVQRLFQGRCPLFNQVRSSAGCFVDCLELVLQRGGYAVGVAACDGVYGLQALVERGKQAGHLFGNRLPEGVRALFECLRGFAGAFQRRNAEGLYALVHDGGDLRGALVRGAVEGGDLILHQLGDFRCAQSRYDFERIDLLLDHARHVAGALASYLVEAANLFLQRSGGLLCPFRQLLREGIAMGGKGKLDRRQFVCDRIGELVGVGDDAVGEAFAVAYDCGLECIHTLHQGFIDAVGVDADGVYRFGRGVFEVLVQRGRLLGKLLVDIVLMGAEHAEDVLACAVEQCLRELRLFVDGGLDLLAGCEQAAFQRGSVDTHDVVYTIAGGGEPFHQSVAACGNGFANPAGSVIKSLCHLVAAHSEVDDDRVACGLEAAVDAFQMRVEFGVDIAGDGNDTIGDFIAGRRQLCDQIVAVIGDTTENGFARCIQSGSQLIRCRAKARSEVLGGAGDTAYEGLAVG